MKTGLILEGGAMRGMFTAGILDVMMENALPFDGIIGVSAGAAFGSNYKSGQIGRAIRYNKAYCADPRYCSFRSLVRTGDLYGAEFCYHRLPTELDPFDWDVFRASPTEFYAVCTDVETGEAVYHLCTAEKGTEDEELEWFRASASMPLVSRVVEINGQRLLDGGVADSIPLRYFQSIGYSRNVVVLTQPDGYVKKKNRAMPMARVSLRKYPRLLDAMANRHTDYNATLEFIRQQEQLGDTLVIRPKEALPIGRVESNPEKLQIVYDLGRQAAAERLSDLQTFLHIAE